MSSSEQLLGRRQQTFRRSSEWRRCRHLVQGRLFTTPRRPGKESWVWGSLFAALTQTQPEPEPGCQADQPPSGQPGSSQKFFICLATATKPFFLGSAVLRSVHQINVSLLFRPKQVVHTGLIRTRLLWKRPDAAAHRQGPRKRTETE